MFKAESVLLRCRFRMLACVQKATTSEWMSGTHGRRFFLIGVGFLQEFVVKRLAQRRESYQARSSKISQAWLPTVLSTGSRPRIAQEPKSPCCQLWSLGVLLYAPASVLQLHCSGSGLFVWRKTFQDVGLLHIMYSRRSRSVCVKVMLEGVYPFSREEQIKQDRAEDVGVFLPSWLMRGQLQVSSTKLVEGPGLKTCICHSTFSSST